MVIGETGQGKSTFLKSILQKYVGSILHYSMKTDMIPSTVEVCEISQFDIPADNSNLNIHLYDSPGFGDEINNQDCLNQLYESFEVRHKSWLNLDGQRLPEEERMNQDTRIHCALYFLSPHRWKKIDTTFIRRLSHLAVIVPVVAKADTMTVIERAAYLAVIESRLDEIVREGFENPCYDFGEEQSTLVDCSNDLTGPGVKVDLLNSDMDLVSPGAPNELTTMPSSLLKVPNIFALSSDASGKRSYPWVNNNAK